MDVLLNRHLSVVRAWMRDDDLGAPEDDVYEAALSLKYLVVHRILRVQLPRIRGDAQSGRAVVEAVVFDLDSEEAVAAYRFVAHTPSTVEAVPRGDETQAEAVERSARSALRKDMRRQIHDQLIEVTGGNAHWDSMPD